jgi:hypothetical protein
MSGSRNVPLLLPVLPRVLNAGVLGPSAPAGTLDETVDLGTRIPIPNSISDDFSAPIVAGFQ